MHVIFYYRELFVNALPATSRAPTMELEAEDAYSRINALVLRNPSTVNFPDGSASSIPGHEPGTALVGLTFWTAQQ